MFSLYIYLIQQFLEWIQHDLVGWGQGALCFPVLIREVLIKYFSCVCLGHVCHLAKARGVHSLLHSKSTLKALYVCVCLCVCVVLL